MHSKPGSGGAWEATTTSGMSIISFGHNGEVSEFMSRSKHMRISRAKMKRRKMEELKAQMKNNKCQPNP